MGIEAIHAAKWLAPFRLLAFVFGLLSLPALVLHSPALSAGRLGVAVVVTAALFCFALMPRALVARFWLAAAALACAGLGYTLHQLRDVAGAGVEPLLLSGHGLMAAVFIAMLIEAVQTRRRQARLA